MRIKDLDTKSINDDQVERSKKWIQKFMKLITGISKKYSCYQLKHGAEKYTHGYISKQSFQKAALELGYKINKNGQLNASYSLAEKNPKESFIDQLY